MDSHSLVFLVMSSRRMSQREHNVLRRRFVQSHMHRLRAGRIKVKSYSFMYLENCKVSI